MSVRTFWVTNTKSEPELLEYCIQAFEAERRRNNERMVVRSDKKQWQLRKRFMELLKDQAPNFRMMYKSNVALELAKRHRTREWLRQFVNDNLNMEYSKMTVQKWVSGETTPPDFVVQYLEGKLAFKWF